MKYLSNKKGEGYIDTGMKVLIGVVVGAVILGGFFLLFKDTLIPKTEQKINQLFNYGEPLQIRQNGTSLEQSYDGENWTAYTIPGTGSSDTIKSALTQQTDDKTVYLTVVKSSSGQKLYVSEDGETWHVSISDSATLSLSRSTSGKLSVHCGDGRGYVSDDGLSWTMTSTKRY